MEEKDRFNGAMHDAEVSAKDYIGNQKEDLKGMYMAILMEILSL